MKFIKKHKIGLIVLVVCIILIVLMFFAVKNAFFANVSQSKYGTRLDGIENYPIDNSTIDDIKTMLNETELVNRVTYDLEGRIINFIIEVKEEVDLTSSRGFADKIAEKFTDEYKSFYDIEVMITSADKENELYPTIGYKHKLSTGFKWNNG